MKTAEITTASILDNLATCPTEASVVAAVMGMNLERENFGWFATKDEAIVIRSITPRSEDDQLEISNPLIRVSEFVFDDEHKIIDSKESEKIPEIPKGKKVYIPSDRFLVARVVNIRFRKIIEMSFFSDTRFNYYDHNKSTHITEEGECRLAPNNLPILIGLVGVQHLTNIQPIVITP